MQSSYNVIKNTNVITTGEKAIVTEYERKVNRLIETEGGQVCTESINLEDYRAMADKIVKVASNKRDSIISEANIRAIEIEREAYEKGYTQGNQNGYEDGRKAGYNEAYENNIERALEEANSIIENANSIMLSAKKDYEAYMTEKKMSIIELAMQIANTVIRKELETPEGITHMVDEVIEKSKNSKSFVIRCNEVHVEELNSKVELWKQTYAQEASIFIVADNLLDPGNAIIEKENGKTTVGIDIGLEKIREEIF